MVHVHCGAGLAGPPAVMGEVEHCMSQVSSSTRSATAADVLGPQLRRQVAAFRAREVEVRLDEPDAVHRFRVAARRLRSLLAAFEQLLDPAVCEALDAELGQAARKVAAARDAQVVQRRLAWLMSDEPDSLPLMNELTSRLETSYAEGRQRAVAHFDSPGYDSFTRVLDGFTDLPPWTPAAATGANQVFVAALRQEWRSMLGKGRRVQLLEAGPVRDHRLHEVRKSAKLVKDVAEAQASISGRKVRRLGKAAGRLSDVLGEHQDLVVTRSVLAEAEADRAAERVLQRVQSREATAAAGLYDDFRQVFKDADRKSLRAWMS